METFQRPNISLGQPKAAPITFSQFGNQLPPFSPAEMSFLNPEGELNGGGPFEHLLRFPNDLNPFDNPVELLHHF